MRQIVLDTETTGLEVGKGHRIIEIGAIELSERRPTGRKFHRYINPQRAIDNGALAVHGINNDFLADKPTFADVARELLDFITGAELIIHNAAFDVEFLNQELSLAGLKKLSDYCPSVVDTLAMARELHPGKKNSLDALCERYMVNNSHRTLHGALLDARLLAEVYLALTRGQDSLVMELEAPGAAKVAAARVDTSKLKVLRASAAEAAAHEKLLDGIDKAAKEGSLWRRLTRA